MTMVATPATNGNGNGAAAPAVLVPFRRASVHKQTALTGITPVYGLTGAAALGGQLPSQGFMERILLPAAITVTPGTGTGPSADLPWDLLSRIRLLDSSGATIYSLSGYNSWLHSKFMMGHRAWIDQSTDTSVFVTADGSGTDAAILLWEIPVATNERDLIGLLPNQSDAYKYTLSIDTPAVASIFGTPGTAAIAGAITPYYDYFTIPPAGVAQNVPDFYGVVHQVTDTVRSFGTAPGSGLRWDLPLGTVYRGMILVTRDAGVRENSISAIRLKAGDDVTIWQASGQEIRQAQFIKNGRDCPTGVYVLDRMSDSGLWIGDDYRSQYIDSRALAQLYLEIDFQNVAGEATVNLIRDTLIVPQGMMV